MQTKNKKRVLVAPLNWGLGHATRSIPIINELQNSGVEVVIAANDQVYIFLKKQFPENEFCYLEGINFTYRKSVTIAVVLQFHKLIKSFFAERSFVNKNIEKLKLDGIISDGRFGLYSKKVPTIYLTHQLFIIAPKVLNFLSNILNYFHQLIINRYTECWVLDRENKNNLAGILSNPKKKPKNIFYIGTISRFKRKSKNNLKNILAVLSGPEPHRTIFESMLIHQSSEINLPLTIVRGISGSNELFKVSECVTLCNNADINLLQKLLDNSSLLISRCGYSTLMDLEVLQKKAILVATPGQTEQEYLAEYNSKNKNYLIVKQEDFDLKELLEQTKFLKTNSDTSFAKNQLPTQISKFISLLK